MQNSVSLKNVNIEVFHIWVCQQLSTPIWQNFSAIFHQIQSLVGPTDEKMKSV